MTMLPRHTRPIAGLLLSVCAIQYCAASTCYPQATIFERADVVVSLIPIQGQLSVELNLALFEADVHRVWKGRVNATESIAVELPRMLTLGDEYVLAVDRDTSGTFLVTSCTPVIEAHDQEDWIREHLGSPTYEHAPHEHSAAIVQ